MDLFIGYQDEEHLIIPPLGFDLQDKVYHAGAYFIMGILLWRFIRYFISNSSNRVITVILFCSLYGISDEWHQSFVAGRYADVGDWIADTLGAMLSAFGFYQYHKKI